MFSDKKIQLASAVVLSLLLAACGGGGGGDNSPADSQNQSQDTPPQPTPESGSNWAYQGSAPMVTGTEGLVAVLRAPATMSSSSIVSPTFNGSGVPLSAVEQQAGYGGAFTTLGTSSSAVSLTSKGTIADITGTGGYVAIGRWTNGSDSGGGSFNANQGAHYVVGNPLKLQSGGTGTLACTGALATSPTAVSGNTAPGKLVSATGTLDLATLTVKDFKVTVTIGSDTEASATKATFSTGGQSMGGGMNVMAQMIGADAAHPMLGILYAAKLPNTGDVNGAVVLACN